MRHGGRALGAQDGLGIDVLEGDRQRDLDGDLGARVLVRSDGLGEPDPGEGDADRAGGNRRFTLDDLDRGRTVKLGRGGIRLQAALVALELLLP